MRADIFNEPSDTLLCPELQQPDAVSYLTEGLFHRLVQKTYHVILRIRSKRVPKKTALTTREFLYETRLKNW